MKQRRQIIDELDRKEVEDFDEEFAAMMQESATQAKTSSNILGNARPREIVIPVSQIRRKMPELSLAQ